MTPFGGGGGGGPFFGALLPLGGADPLAFLGALLPLGGGGGAALVPFGTGGWRLRWLVCSEDKVLFKSRVLAVEEIDVSSAKET